MVTRLVVVTGSRSEAGLLAPLVEEFRQRPGFELIVVATGDHLSPAVSRKDLSLLLGFSVEVLVPSLVSKAGVVDVAGSVAGGLRGFASLFSELEPDLVMVLGDRFETYAAALACHFTNTPLAHIHGGEITLGSLDDSLRHSITKFARVHFVAHEEYRRRVIQLGESPSTTHVVGGLGIDVIRRTAILDELEIEKALGRRIDLPIVMVSVHPESNSPDPARSASVVREALRGIDGALFAVSISSSDLGSEDVNKVVRGFADSQPSSVLIPSMGSRLYLSLLAQASVLVGNSSSGILEAPAVGTPSLNVGDRQSGRVRPPSVHDVGFDVDQIRKMVKEKIRVPRKQYSELHDLTFGDGMASQRIVDHIASLRFPLSPKMLFYDVQADFCPDVG